MTPATCRPSLLRCLLDGLTRGVAHRVEPGEVRLGIERRDTRCARSTSAASARSWPGPLVAAMSASASSLRAPSAVLRRHQPVELLQREGAEALDDRVRRPVAARAPDSCSSPPHSVTRHRVPIRAPSASPRWPRMRRGSSGPPVSARSCSKASRYGAGDGLLSGVSPEATMVVKSGPTPAASRISSISWRSAPDAIAIGTASAAAPDELDGAGKQHRSGGSSSCRRSPFRPPARPRASRHRQAAIARQRLEARRRRRSPR